jgi:hypothetical protein
MSSANNAFVSPNNAQWGGPPSLHTGHLHPLGHRQGDTVHDDLSDLLSGSDDFFANLVSHADVPSFAPNLSIGGGGGGVPVPPPVPVVVPVGARKMNRFSWIECCSEK